MAVITCSTLSFSEPILSAVRGASAYALPPLRTALFAVCTQYVLIHLASTPTYSRCLLKSHRPLYMISQKLQNQLGVTQAESKREEMTHKENRWYGSML